MNGYILNYIEEDSDELNQYKVSRSSPAIRKQQILWRFGMNRRIQKWLLTELGLFKDGG